MADRCGVVAPWKAGVEIGKNLVDALAGGIE